MIQLLTGKKGVKGHVNQKYKYQKMVCSILSDKNELYSRFCFLRITLMYLPCCQDKQGELSVYFVT